MLVTIRYRGKDVKIEVNEQDYVASLKAKFHDKEGVVPGNQKLQFDGKELEDDYTLAFYRIINYSVLNFGPPTYIFVKTLVGKTITIEIKDCKELVSSIKEKIKVKEGFALHDQRLIYEAKQLEDEETLSSYGIKKNSTLHLVIRLPGGILYQNLVF